MSRCGYSDDISTWDLIRWRGAVKSAIRGKRGQAFLRELLAALDALPAKRLTVGVFERGDEVCALGCIGRMRGLDMSDLDPVDREEVAKAFGISEAMAAEIMFWNDEVYVDTPEGRYEAVRKFIEAELVLPNGC